MEHVVEAALERFSGHIVLGLPLGLGKPNRLVNAFYRRACDDRNIRLDVVTALSLDPPQPKHWLQARLLEPILARQFGTDYPRLDYVADLVADRLPANIRVHEFYFQSGNALGHADMQRHYVSSNYTHVARDLLNRGINVVAQLVAGPVDGRYSLSCNPDVSLDLKALAKRRNHPLMVVGQVHPDLPFMHGDAVVDADYFDQVIDTNPDQPLFALPRMPVSIQDYAVGFHASRLVADGGTLQIGIGSLSDALVHGLILRHRNTGAWRELEAALDGPVPEDVGGRGPFEAGLYGASEMFMDGFMHLYKAGILKREVFDDPEIMARVNRGETVAQAGKGVVMDGGFFLGTKDFYAFLNGLDEDERPRFRMHGVGRINQLYGGWEALEIAQRQKARFINTTMMVTATGAAVSDGLQDYQVVSGVGGQYNFVAMAHAIEGGRSALMLRAARGSGSDRSSNIVWEYPHATIPRHLRDLVVTEYGVADLRSRSDEECIQALICIADRDFQDELVQRAVSAGKLDRQWRIPDSARRNTPARLAEAFADVRGRGLFPDYPFGSDFTALERRLIPALQKLQELSTSRWQLVSALLRGRPAAATEALQRLGLDAPRNLKERAYARLVAAVIGAA